jgi:hypothetical protein
MTLRREIFLLSEDFVPECHGGVGAKAGESPSNNSEHPGRDDDEPLVPARPAVQVAFECLTSWLPLVYNQQEKAHRYEPNDSTIWRGPP